MTRRARYLQVLPTRPTVTLRHDRTGVTVTVSDARFLDLPGGTYVAGSETSRSDGAPPRRGAQSYPLGRDEWLEI